MRKKYLPLLLLSILLPYSASAALFSDDFHRADDISTGNGWADTEVGSGSTWGISNDREFSTSNNNGDVVTYRTDIGLTSGIAVKGIFSSPSMSHAYIKVG